MAVNKCVHQWVCLYAEKRACNSQSCNHFLEESKFSIDNKQMDAITLCKRMFKFTNDNGNMRISPTSYWWCELEKIEQQHH